MALDISRLTAGVSDLLPPEVSDDIWGGILETSAVMRLAQQTVIPPGGEVIPVVTGEPEPQWVDETDESPVSNSTIGSKTIRGYQLSVTEAFSKRLLSDLPGLYKELARRLPFSLSRKYDRTVFGMSGPGEHFATLGAATAVALSPGTGTKTTHKGLVDAVRKVADADGGLNGWALTNQAKALLLDQVDTTNRPLLFDSITEGSAVSQLLAIPAVYTRGAYVAGTPNTIGFAGDWNSARWGMIDDISVEMSEHASVTNGTKTYTVGTESLTLPNQVNLWQRGMFALKVTAWFGFQVEDVAKFVKLTDAVRS